MDIKSWLESIELGIYSDIFTENCLEMEDLQELTAEELKDDLGITKLGHRKQILKAISNLSNFSTEELSVIDNYPYSISLPYKQMLTESNYFLKLQLMKDVFLNILKYLGLVVASEYFSSDLKNKEITALFRSKLFQPHFGNWNHFIRESILYLEKENYQFKIPELPKFYAKIEGGKKAVKYSLQSSFTDEYGEIQIVNKSMPAISALINFRNRFVGHGITLSSSKSKEVYQLYNPILSNLLKELHFVTAYPMYKISSGKKFHLMGAALNIKEEVEEKEEKIWLHTPNGELYLVPFFIQPDKFIADADEQIKLFIYEQFTGKRIVYFSPEQETGETSGEPVNILNTLLSSKEQTDPLNLIDLTLQDIYEILNDNSLAIIAGLKKEQKIIDSIYQPRLDSERSLHSFMQSNKQLYFIAAEAGAGKTNLLVEFYRQISKSNKRSLLLRALHLPHYSMTENLKLIFNVSDLAGIETSSLLSDFAEEPFLIIIDGCNEHKSPQLLLDSCCELIENFPLGSIKIVVSWRINSPSDYPVLKNDLSTVLFDGDTTSRSDAGVNQLRDRAAILKPLNKIEVNGIWSLFKKTKHFIPQFSFADLELRDRSFADQLSNPLVLRLFLQQNHGKGLSQKRKDLRIWPNWYNNLEIRIPGAHNFLTKILKVISSRQTSILDFDSLFDIPELSEDIRTLSISSPYQRLLSLGVISQYTKDGVIYLTFTMEGAYHYLLSRFIKEEMSYNDGNELTKLINSNKNLPGFNEAAGYCLLTEVLQGELNNLMQFISYANDEIAVSSPALAKAVILYPPEKILDNISIENADNFVIALLLADFSLERNLATQKRYNLIKTLISKREIGSLSGKQLSRLWYRFNLICHEFGKYEESLEAAKTLHSIQIKISSETSLEMAAVYGRLAVAYRKLMRNSALESIENYGNLALDFETKALNIRRKLLPEFHLEIAHSLDNMEKIYEYKKEWQKAVEFGKKLINHYSKMFDPNHPLLASAYNNTAIVLRENNQKKRSIEYSYKAMEIARKTLGETHLEMAYANWTLANTYSKFAYYEDAASCMNKTISILAQLIPENHPNFILANKQLARIVMEMEKNL